MRSFTLTLVAAVALLMALSTRSAEKVYIQVILHGTNLASQFHLVYHLTNDIGSSNCFYVIEHAPYDEQCSLWQKPTLGGSGVQLGQFPPRPWDYMDGYHYRTFLNVSKTPFPYGAGYQDWPSDHFWP